MAKRLSIDDMHQTAALHGGFFRSDEYLGSNIKHLWECSEGHQWYAKPEQVRHGSWCIICARIKQAKLKKNTIKDMHTLAAKKGFKCLSTKYNRMSDKLLWECSNGHRFKMTPINVKADHSCPCCSRYRRMTIEDMQKIARERGGKCISERYVNCFTKLYWVCSKGHRWWATPNNVKHYGSWCPVCWRVN